MNRVSRRQALLVTSAFALLPAVGHADDWPKARPLRAVVPFAAGSSTDILARTVLDEVAKLLGQTIVVENRAGASGTIGANAVAKADPDGYTLLIHSSSHTVTPSTFNNPPYNAEADFAPVVPLATIPNVVVVNPAKGYRTLRDLVDAAKKNPGAFNYASAGAGSATHLTAERLKMAAGLDGQHIAFKGSSEALTEVIAGRVDFYCSPVNAAIELIKDNRVTALAVSSAQRASALPDVPTTVEAGFPDSGYEFWIGAFLPRQTPKPIVERLHAEILKALAGPALMKKFSELGADPLKISSAEFEALIKHEIQANAALVKAAGIKAN
ncbi:MAG TPA: tripartite tricarboxylate transporter substrate binding protein [Xanthobacteraceae bacterium]|jgi:tripartite-type tricarboxylate transporter receptor subunit TctC